MARTGRPKIEIDWEQFDKLCEMHCTLTEIASIMRCSEDTIERAVRRKTRKKMTFAEYFRLKSGTGKAALRRKQWQVAMGEMPVVEIIDGKRNVITKGIKSDTGMQIWLGKQYLSQAEKHEVTGKDGGPIQVCPWDLSKLTIEELKTLEAIAEKAGGRLALPPGDQD